MSEDSANKDEIKWGAEIEVGDAKPDFLKQYDVEDMLIVFNGGFARMPVTGCDSLDKWGWNMIKGIRLPADHPYYAQEKADEAFAAKLLDADVRGVMRRRERQEDVATTAIDPALVERMVALVKELAIEAREPVNSWFHHWVEARDIIKALEPVDPDVAIAEDIAASFHEGEYEAIALAALKRGRQLEREETNA